jgi:putative inorganic carbon (hco3(-)) transporter
MWFHSPPIPPRPQDLHRIALVCFGGIGDVLLFSPVAVALKAAFPHAHLTLFVEDRSLAVKDLIPQVDAFHPLPMHLPRHKLFFHLVDELKRRHYDGVMATGSSPFIAPMLALSGVRYRVGYTSRTSGLLSQAVPVHRKLYASQMHWALLEGFVQGVGLPVSTTVRVLPHIVPPTPDELTWANQLLVSGLPRRHNLTQTVLIHPGVSQLSLQKGINKTWSAAAWAQLVLALSQDVTVLLVGGPDDRNIIDDIVHQVPAGLENIHNLFGETRSLRDLAALMAVADAVVCVDSSPLHLAVALGRPTVALFGPTDEAKLVPDASVAPRVRVATYPVPCRPCLWDVRQTNCGPSTCLRIEPETVLALVRASLR